MKKNKVEVSSRFRQRKVNNSNLIRKSKKEYQKIIFLAVFLLAIFCGTSYALFSNVVKSTKTIEVTSGTFKVEFKESNSVKLNNAAPVTDEVGMNNTPYTFTIDNTGTLPAKYNISLEEDSKNTLDRKYIKYSIKEDNGEWSTPTLIENGLILTSNRLLSSGEKTNYELKMWLDENADNSTQGKSYNAKIVINSVQTNANLTDVTSPIIQLNGNSTINLEQNKSFKDPGISSIKDDEDEISVNDVTKRYEYFDGENINQVDNIDTTKIGTYYIYYEVRDKKNNLGTTIRIVNIYKNDTSIPTISLIGDEIVKLNYGDLYNELGAVAQDEKDGSLTSKIVTVGTVNTKKEGTYIIKYLIENSDGNTASVTRTVLVQRKTGKLIINTTQNDEDITKTLVYVEVLTDAESYKISITSDNKKPSDKTFKSITELEKIEKAENGNLIFTKNGTYFIWVKDSNGNIAKKKIKVTTIDETIPTCEFSEVEYIGINTTKEMELTCTDIADIKYKYLTDSMFSADAKTSAEITNISSPERVDNGYKYKITIKALQEEKFNISLLKNSIYDGADNPNDKITSNDIKVSTLTAQNSILNLDVNNKNTEKISVDGTNIGNLTYETDNSNIATVTNEGQVKAIAPGVASITVAESNGGAKTIVTVNVEKTLSATFEKYGSGTDTISSTMKSCKLTPTNPTTCHVTGPDINTKEGYTAIGWNKDKTSHTGSYDLELSDNETYYSITKKNSVTLISTFNGNGATLSPENGITTCTLGEVFNNEHQETSCTVTLPEIIASENTPIVVGFVENTPSLQNDSTVLNAGDELTLTEKNSSHTWYAITKSAPITYKVSYKKNSAGVKEIGKDSDTCTIPETFNGIAQDKSCTVTLPSITTNEGYTAIGWNKDNTSHTGTVQNENVQLSSDTTYYAISSKDELTYKATFVKSGLGVSSISATTASCTIPTVYNNEEQNKTCTVALPTMEVTGLYKSLGWSQNQNATTNAEDMTAEEGYKGVEISLDKKSTTLYSISKKDELTLSATFNDNGTTLSSNTIKTCTLQEAYNNDPRNDYCTFDTPLISRDNFDIVGYNLDKDSHTNNSAFNKTSNQITIDSTNNDQTWYAISKRDLNVTYSKNGPTTISKEKDACTIWNSANECQITTAEISRPSFDIIGWNQDKNADELSTDTDLANQTISINDNKDYYAITKKQVVINYHLNGALGQTDDIGQIVSDSLVTRTCKILNTETECQVTSPAIAASYNTPDVIGYSLANDKTTSDWNVVTPKNVTDNANYYAITKKQPVTYSTTFNKQGLGVNSISSTESSCTIKETYNGTKQDSTCSVVLPSIDVQEGYTALGWSENKDATKDFVAQGEQFNLGKDTSLYAISKKDEIILTGTFYKNGAESQTYSADGVITKSTDDKVDVSCKLEDAYNNDKQATNCSIISPIINASTNTPDVVGYAATNDALLSSLGQNIKTVLTSDVKYYAITKKDAITLSATWNGNNSTISSTDEKNCTLPKTYNGNKQPTSCTVTAPDVASNKNTPTFIGFSTNHNDTKNDSLYNKTTNLLTLTEENNEKTWYAITEKAAETYNVNYEVGSHVSKISKTTGSCKIAATYNGTKQSSTCIISEDDTENNPVITPNTGYTSLGWSQLNGTTVGSPAVVLTKNNMTFYANASANNYNINFYSDNALIGTNKVTYDKSFKLSTINELNLTKRGYTFKKWSSNGVTYDDGATISENLASEEGTNVRFDAVWADEEKPVCRFISIGSTTTQNETIVRVECTDTGSGVVSKNLSTSAFSVSDSTYGKVVSVSNPISITEGYAYDVTVRGLAVGTFNVSMAAGSISDSSNNTNLAVTTSNPVIVTGRVYSVKYSIGNNISSIGSNIGSCTTTGSNVECDVVLPSITPNKGYTVNGWINQSNPSTILAVGSSYTLNDSNDLGNNLILTSNVSDVTPPTCSITGTPTSWTQSSVLTINANDDGSGLAQSPYSWTSRTAGYSATPTKTVTANGNYTAYVLDADGNIGSCSTTVEKVDTTAPSCTWASPSDTSITAGNTATLDIMCTDTQGGITNQLSTSSFSTTNTNAKVKSVSSPTDITNGSKYTVTVEGVAYGTFSVNLNKSAITDTAGNSNNANITSSEMTSYNKASVGSCNTGLIYNASSQTLASGGTGVSFTNNSRTEAGSSVVTMTPKIGYMFQDEAESKTTTCSIGQRAITYTADSSTKTYDADTMSNQSATLTSGSIVSGHTAIVSVNGSITNAGSVDNVLESVVIKDSSSNNVTSNYAITKTNGKLTVNKRDTTCTAGSTNTAYTGSSISNSNVSCTNLIANHTATASMTSSSKITDVGTVKNVIDTVNIVDSAKISVTNNYNVTKVDGSIVVNKTTSSISMSATTATYNGSAISVSATGTGSISYKYYSNNTCTSEISAPIDAGTYYAKATSTGDSNHTGATSNCVSHTISKKSVAVNWGSTTSFTYNGSAQAPSASASSGVSGETLNVSRTTATATGSYTSTASLSSVSGGRGKTSNYTLTGTTKAFTINGITRSVSFNANGNTISKNSDYCITSGTSTECNITAPMITASSNTPNVIGFSTAATTHLNEWSNGETKSIDSDTAKTWYAQSYKAGTSRKITFNANGATSIGSTSKSCTIDAVYNGSSQGTTCSITAPTITQSNAYIVGWNTSSSSVSSTWNVNSSKSFDGNATYYAIVIKDILYNCTKEMRTFTAPKTGYYQIQLWGAAGGGAHGGHGGYTSGKIYLNANQPLYFFVGGKPTKVTEGGYNGGGASNSDGRYHSGGGATSVSVSSGGTSDWNNVYVLASRIMVAGGGGGGFVDTTDTTFALDGGSGGHLYEGGYGIKGHGKAYTENNSNDISAITEPTGGDQRYPGVAGSGTQTKGRDGAFGIGANSEEYYSAAGGGGWYGGGSSGVNYYASASGAGGSSYISGHVGCIAYRYRDDESLCPNHSKESAQQQLECSTQSSTWIFKQTVAKSGVEAIPMPYNSGTMPQGNPGNGIAQISYKGSSLN